jgi:hypothetical protein
LRFNRGIGISFEAIGFLSQERRATKLKIARAAQSRSKAILIRLEMKGPMTPEPHGRFAL